MKKREGEREIKPEFLKEIATRERSPKLKGERREKERARLEIFSFSAVVKARVFKFIHEGVEYKQFGNCGWKSNNWILVALQQALKHLCFAEYFDKSLQQFCMGEKTLFLHNYLCEIKKHGM